jgi:hypothetical protein
MGQSRIRNQDRSTAPGSRDEDKPESQNSAEECDISAKLKGNGRYECRREGKEHRQRESPWESIENATEEQHGPLNSSDSPKRVKFGA